MPFWTLDVHVQKKAKVIDTLIFQITSLYPSKFWPNYQFLYCNLGAYCRIFDTPTSSYFSVRLVTRFHLTLRYLFCSFHLVFRFRTWCQMRVLKCSCMVSGSSTVSSVDVQLYQRMTFLKFSPPLTCLIMLLTANFCSVWVAFPRPRY